MNLHRRPGNIEKRLADKENPLVIPKNQLPAAQTQKALAQPKPRIDEQKRDSAQLMQKKAATQAPNPAKIASTQWMDPPKRQTPFRRSCKNG